MVIFGLVMLLLAVLIVIAAVTNGGTPASLDLQLFTIKTNVTGVFVGGAATLLLAALGLALVLGGLRHDRRRRGEIKELKKRASRRDRGSAPSDTSKPAPRTTDSAPPPSGSGSTSGSSAGSTSGSSTPPASGSSDGSATPVQRERGDEGPDEYFDSAPRDR